MPPSREVKASRDLPLPFGTLVGLVAAMIAAALIAVVTIRASADRREAASLVSNALQILQQTEEVLSAAKDVETGQRGFLLTQLERYLEPYEAGRSAIPGMMLRLGQLVSEDAQQTTRVHSLGSLLKERVSIAEQTVLLQRSGTIAESERPALLDRGKAAMDGARAVANEIAMAERALIRDRQEAWEDAGRLSDWVTWAGSAILILLVAIAAVVMSRDYQQREARRWLDQSRMALASRLQGEARLSVLGARVLDFLGEYLDSPVGAIHAVDVDGQLSWIAGYAAADRAGRSKEAGEGLAGQAVRENRVLHVQNVPAGYLPVSSSLGQGVPAQLLLAPAAVDGEVQAVIELGFFREVEARERELMTSASEALGVAVRSSRDRTRLEELLEETQRQSEELQTQQEELRVSNEELAEQSSVLEQSQSRLEIQQVELEQTNAHLEEQTHLLEAQKAGLKRAQDDLIERANDLEHANRYKSEFLANMSHELRTPLNSALVLATLLADNRTGNLTEEQVTFARTIYEAGNDLLALINDVLDLSKIESGKVDLDIENVSLDTTLDSLAKSFEPLAIKKGIVLRAERAPDAPDTIVSDAQRLGQVLKNLLSNALKFTERGSITLRVTRASPSEIAFAVEDSGIGIPSQQHGVIFEAFRQADGSTHRKYGGTGLGLSISRDIAHLLGGDLTVTSEPGRGSTFTLTLPVRFVGAVAKPSPPERSREEVAPQRLAPRSAQGSPASVLPGPPAISDDRGDLNPDSRRILIVEDDQRFAAILRDLARERGFQTIVTHTASDGVAAAAAYGPNAVLLDIHLPDGSGLAVLDRLKRDPKTRHLPVHVLSVADESHQALERGAVGFALKPVQRDALADAFAKIESKISQETRRVLIVEDDARQRESVAQLLAADNVVITGAATAAEALEQLRRTTFDCVVMDLKLPDRSGAELLQQMAEQDDVSFPPVIVYTGRSVTPDEEQQLRRFSKSIIIKDARSPERLLAEVTLFLHQVEANLPEDRQRMLKAARDRDEALDSRRILVVDDDARNIFALSHVLEPRGAKVEIARNGREALESLDRLERAGTPADLVLMDLMMPEMDGLTAMQEIRKRPDWKTLPIIALTAKAMRDDQEKCRAAGANDYIAKPFDVDRLLSLIRVWIRR